MKKFLWKKSAYYALILALVFISEYLDDNHKGTYFCVFITLFVLLMISVVRFIGTENKLSDWFEKQEDKGILPTQNQLDSLRSRISNNKTIDAFIMLVIGVIYFVVLLNLEDSKIQTYMHNEMLTTVLYIASFVLFAVLLRYLSVWSSCFKNLTYKIETYECSLEEIQAFLGPHFMKIAKDHKFEILEKDFYFIDVADPDNEEERLISNNPYAMARYLNVYKEIMKEKLDEFISDNKEEEERIQKNINSIKAYM